MSGFRPSARVAVLLLAAAFVVHELRYLLAYGERAQETLAHEGHGYLTFAGPALGLALAWLLARLIVRVAQIGPTHPATPIRVARLWPLCSTGLLAIYSSQELLEGALAPGHPAGLVGVFGGGGWIAVPLALIAGGVLALLVRVVRMVERGIAPARLLTLRLVAPAAFVLAGAWRELRVGLRLAEHRAPRGPPLLLVHV